MENGFDDRLDAGRRLATRLEAFRGSGAKVVGLARGGVEVGYAVAEALNLPLLALVVRKIGAPSNPELAIGAVSETGARRLDHRLATLTGATDAYIEEETGRQVREAQRRQQVYAVGPELGSMRGCPVIVTDDGVATGASALVGAMSARDLGASEVILAVPVASPSAMALLEPAVDHLVVLDVPPAFHAVGLYYRNFDQVSDGAVIKYLARAPSGGSPASSPGSGAGGIDTG